MSLSFNTLKHNSEIQNWKYLATVFNSTDKNNAGYFIHLPYFSPGFNYFLILVFEGF